MPVTVKNISLWRKEVENQVGTLAHALEPVTKAGANLHVLMGYRYPGEGTKAAIELYPIAGKKVNAAASEAGVLRKNQKSIAMSQCYIRPRFCPARIFAGLETPLWECLRQLGEDCQNGRFLVIDYEKSNEEIVRLLVMGAHGFVTHADVSRTLVRALIFIAAGHFWVAPEVMHDFMLEVGGALRKGVRCRQSTTRREDEILELVRRRLSNREIAALLQIRVSTVKFHLSNILSKLHASNRRELSAAPAHRTWKMVLR